MTQKLGLIGIAAIAVLLAGGISGIFLQPASALLYGGVKRLEVYMYLHTEDGKAKDVKASITFHNIVKTKKITVQPTGTRVLFEFPPLGISLFDNYQACAENTRTQELNCTTVLWWDHDHDSQVDLTVYNTK